MKVLACLSNKVRKSVYIPLFLFLMLSALLHLLVWSGFVGFGAAFLAGLDRASHGEVVDFLIADPAPPEAKTAEAPSVAGGGATNRQPSSVKPSFTQAEAQPAASSEDPAMAAPSALPEDARKAAAEGASVPDAPHDNAAAVTAAQQTQSAGIERNESPGSDAAGKTAVARTAPTPDIFPFAEERLIFSLYWSGIPVGTATLEAVRGEVTSSITSVVHSNEVISSFYKVEDRAEARLSRGRPASFTLIQNEGKHHRNKETVFEPDRNKVTFINHLDKSRQEHDMSGKVLWDVISGFYYLRRQPLEIGKSVYITMFDSNKFLNAEVKVLRRETLELEEGEEIATIIVEPILTSEGLFQKSGKILIWLTDDERRMPVRMETKLKIGRVTAKLKSFDIKKPR